jgi:hypothetical protein
VTDDGARKSAGSADVNGNDVVAFLVELLALVALGAWGFQAGQSMAARVLLGLGAPAVAIVLWALFAAPRAAYQVPGLRLTVKVLVLGSAVLAAFALLPVGWAAAFAVVVLVNTGLMYVGPFAR